MSAAYWLPLVFVGLMALAMLLYVVLDGFDLGVGMLLPLADDADRDRMIASIGPFWDANETWLVLGVGVLLIAFPAAHGIILTALYLPIFCMLFALVLRGVAFDFRYKAEVRHKGAWDRAFFAGSLGASLAQGFMLGRYITGFEDGWLAVGFALLTAVCTAAGYALLGAGWLIMKSEHALRGAAYRWARVALGFTALGVVAVSAATPLVSARVFERWFSFPEWLLLAPVPLLTAVCVFVAWRHLGRARVQRDWVPFACAVAVFVLSFSGLAYSLFPYLVLDELDIWKAASDTGSLFFVLFGAALAVPAILAYTAFAYYVFRGRSSDLSYD